MAYPPVNPAAPLEPTDFQFAKYGAAELRALKQYLIDSVVPYLIKTPAAIPAGIWLPTIRVTAPTGYVLIPGSMTSDVPAIGDQLSVAQVRANADCANLYAELWANPSTKVYTTGGTLTTKGTSAAADFAAHKAVSIPPIAGKVLGAAGANGFTLWGNIGEATHTLTALELPDHTHGTTNALKTTGGTVSWYIGTGGVGTTAQGATETVAETHGQSHNNVQPTFVCNWLLSL